MWIIVCYVLFFSLMLSWIRGEQGWVSGQALALARWCGVSAGQLVAACGGRVGGGRGAGGGGGGRGGGGGCGGGGVGG